MRLKLKEDPREWRKFMLVWCAVAAVLLGWLAFRRILAPAPAAAAGALVIAFAAAAAVAPRLFRPAYRAGMTLSFYVGQFMGAVILTVFYLFVLTPMGLLLRLAGKDLLDLKLDRSADSCWKPARKPGPLEQQF